MKKFIIARNDWCANHILKRIKQGRIPETVLYNTRNLAVSRMKKMPMIKQEEFSIFEVNYKKVC